MSYNNVLVTEKFVSFESDANGVGNNEFLVVIVLYMCNKFLYFNVSERK